MEALEQIKVQTSRQRKQASLDTANASSEQMTVPVVFATESPVLTRNWRIDDGKPFYEVLSFEKNHIRSERADSGLGVFRDHYTSSSSQIGIAEGISFDKEGKAVVRFSKNEMSFYEDVVSGIRKNVSVGFNVYKYEDISEEGAATRTLRAIDWEPMEISFVGVQADVNSGTRDENPTHETIISQKRQIIDNSNNNQMTEAEKLAAEQARAAENKTIADNAAKAERARTAEITKIVRTAKLGDDFATDLIERGISIEEARKQVLDKWTEAQSAAETNNASDPIKVGREEKEKVNRAIEDAITLRANPSMEKDMKAEDVSTAREFRNLSMIEIGREFLVRNNVDIKGMTKREIASAVLGMNSRAMSTSDFPFLLEATFKRTLRKAYEMTTPTYEPFTSKGTMPDFRDTSRVQLSGLVGAFEEIPQGGEYKEGTMKEGKETYKLIKYGKKVAFTWESMMNDDLTAFSRIPVAIANEAQQKKSDIVYSLLAANAAMSDGFALFSTQHGNLRSVGAAPSETTLSDARLAMRLQKDLNDRFINVTAKYIVCGPALETTVQKILQAVIIATKTSDTNIFKGSLMMIVEPRITDNTYYFMADPTSVDTIETSTLEGEPDLFTETRYGFDVDGVEMKARMVFAAKALDHRGMYKVPTY
jgi:hypothetical protein